MNLPPIVTQMTALLLALAIWVGIRNVLYHMNHDDHEGVAKWTVMTLLFGISLLISLFA